MLPHYLFKTKGIMVGLFFPFVLIVSLHITLAKHYEYKSQEDNTLLKAQTSCLETSMSTFTFRLHYPFQDNSSDLDLRPWERDFFKSDDFYI